MTKATFLRALVGAAALSCLGGRANAQFCTDDQLNVDGDPFYEAWVDPCAGSDLTGVVSTPTTDPFPVPVASGQASPFRTIQAAINAVSARPPGGLNAVNPGLVHLNPGIYELDDTTGRIVLRPFVNLQGVGARQCVVRGTTDQLPSFVFLPDDDCDCGMPGSLRVLLDLSQAAPGNPFSDPYEEMVDGITFQGGDVQVYVAGEGKVRARLSNCVFDMIDYAAFAEGDLSVPGPLFGVLMVHVYCPDLMAGQTGVEDGYADVPLQILNNTFVQSWIYHEDPSSQVLPKIGSAKCDSVAICDMNNPLCGNPFSDPDTTIRGIGNPSIQNNLIRAVDHDLLASAGLTENGAVPGCAGTPRSFLGIDATDTRVSDVYTNLFWDEFDLDSETSADGAFCVQIPGAGQPFPAQALSSTNPAFVGELLAKANVNAGPGSKYYFPVEYTRDWRLLFQSMAVDGGIAPDGMSTITADNGTVYVEPDAAMSSCAYSALNAYDFDGEGYGNPRIVGGTVDIGFDEVDANVECGYYNDSILISPTPPMGHCLPDGASGRGWHLNFFRPAPAFPSTAGMYTSRLVVTPRTGAAYSTFPGALVPAALEPVLGTWWISPTTPVLTMNSLTAVNFYRPWPGAISEPTQPFNFLFSLDPNGNDGDQIALQGEYTDGGGATVRVNLQPSID